MPLNEMGGLLRPGRLPQCRRPIEASKSVEEGTGQWWTKQQGHSGRHRCFGGHRRGLCRPAGGQGHDLVLVARRADNSRNWRKLRYAYGRKVSVISADLADDNDVRRVGGRSPPTTMTVGQQCRHWRPAGRRNGRCRCGRAHDQGQRHRLDAADPRRAAELVARNRGAIVNIASVLAFDTSFGGIYSGTKAYVVNYRSPATQVADTGVKVQVMLPGRPDQFWACRQRYRRPSSGDRHERR